MFSKYIHVAFEWEPYKNSFFMDRFEHFWASLDIFLKFNLQRLSFYSTLKYLAV